MMVGMNISDEQLGGIADRAISDADIDKDGAISFEELKRVSKCGVLFNYCSNRLIMMILRITQCESQCSSFRCLLTC